MKRILIGMIFLSASVDAANNKKFFLETGIGVEYGGLGVQYHLPFFDIKDIEIYISTGIFGVSSNTDENVDLGAGVGFNYFLDKKHSLAVYAGVLNSERYLNESFVVKTELDYGLSVGYKYFLQGKGKSGMSLGVTYNVYDDGHYPFLSLGYRY